MTQLQDLLLKVREENLTKFQLEEYFAKLSNYLSDLHITLADLEKKEAMFMINDPEKTDALMKRLWRGSEDGLRKIEIVGLIRATRTQLNGLKARIFQTL